MPPSVPIAGAAAQPRERAGPTDIFNSPGFFGMPTVVAGEHSTRLTEADNILAALYHRIVKTGDLSTINADLRQLSRVMANSVGFGDGDNAQRASNVYVGKALNILCHLLRRDGPPPCDGALLVRAVERCAMAIAERREFNLVNLSLVMFHFGELINHPPLQDVCRRIITDHLAPIFEATLRRHPLQAMEGATFALGLVSVLRASESQLAHPSGGALPRPAADSLLLILPRLLEANPGLLRTWENRTLALLSHYGVKYLGLLDHLGRRHGSRFPVDALQLNAACALKPIIDEARLLARGVWNQRDSAYRGFVGEKRLRDYLAYSTRYYCKWLARQPVNVQARFALQEAERGPLADNPYDGRGFAAVVGNGHLPGPASALDDGASVMAPTPSPVPGPASRAVARPGPHTLLDRFSGAVATLLRLGEDADRFDREAVIHASNALIASIAAGRTPLNETRRVQMLIDMDAVCRHLHAADPVGASHYGWQLSSMRGFLSSQLALLVGPEGRPLMGTDVPFDSGLSSWQRTLLNVLRQRDDE